MIKIADVQKAIEQVTEKRAAHAYAVAFYGQCKQAGMSDEQIKEALNLGGMLKGLGQRASVLGMKGMSHVPTPVLRGATSAYRSAQPFLRGAGELGKGFAEDIRPLTSWAKAHPVMAGGTGLGLIGAGEQFHKLLGAQ